jgi:protein O-mannosyl-transferase
MKIAIPSLIVLTFIAYANSLHGQFVFDDPTIIFQNPQLINIRTLEDVFALGTGWRQLLLFTYGLNFYWSQLNTYSYHVVNVLLHAVNALLVYFIVREIAPNPWKQYSATTAAAVFSVHTLFTGAVSYIAGRSSVLCAMFYFAAVLLFLKARTAERTTVRLAYLSAAALSAFLAWQTKQEMLALPVLLAAIVWLQSERRDVRTLSLTAPLIAIPLAVVFILRKEFISLFASVARNEGLVNAGFESVLEPAVYFRTYLTSVISYYFPRIIVPVNLNADPQILTVEHWYSPEFVFAVVVLVSLAWIALRYSRTQPLLSLGLAALLVSPLSAYALIPLADVVLEHRAYIPGLGIAILFAWTFTAIAKTYPWLKWIAPATVVVAFTVATLSRNIVWADNTALWTDVEKKSPGKPRAHFNLGSAYQSARRFNEAVVEYNHALKLKPDLQAAYSNIAAIQLDSGQLEDAEATLLKVTEVAPNYPDGFINLAVLYIRKREPDKAVAALDHVLAQTSDSFVAHYNMGEALTLKGDFKNAAQSYSRAVALRPDLDWLRLRLGMAYVRAGDRVSAEKELLMLLDTPQAPDAYRSLGALNSEAGNNYKAIEYLRQAIRLRPVYPDAHQDLGVLYIREKMLDLAIQEFRSTLEQKPDYGPAVLDLSLAYQLKGDSALARRSLESYLQKYATSGSPFVSAARERLATLSIP